MPDGSVMSYEDLLALCEAQLARDRAEWADRARDREVGSLIYESIDSLSVAVACMHRRIRQEKSVEQTMLELSGDRDPG